LSESAPAFGAVDRHVFEAVAVEDLPCDLGSVIPDIRSTFE
jgi:hypothetical protein